MLVFFFLFTKCTTWLVADANGSLWRYLGEIFVKLWVEESHLRLHVLVQDQGEDGEHGVDGGVPAERTDSKHLLYNLKYVFLYRERRQISVKFPVWEIFVNHIFWRPLVSWSWSSSADWSLFTILSCGTVLSSSSWATWRHANGLLLLVSACPP